MAQRHAQLTFPDRPRNLQIGDELNKGAWGVVYNGELEGRPVAVKGIHELLQQGGSEEGRRKLFEDFREECKKLQALSHPHVVGFIGAFNDPRLGPILVMEKMQENLRDFLVKGSKRLSLLKQFRISLEIIRGVVFLHQQTPPLVHRDLNDKNVMFSFEGVIKIGDFGQSKLKKDLYLTTGQPGMVTFMPPEALKVAKSKYNESLDIFSVGVLMLEIGTQQEPLVNLYGIGIIREVERREEDLKALVHDHPLRPQILLCLKDNPKERPKASDLQRQVLALVDGGVETRDERLTSEITTLQAALAKAREENASRREREAKLQREIDIEKKAKHELAERCEQLQLQVKAYEEDFKTERRDRESAHDKFADREKKWREELENLTQERDRLTGNILTLKDQLVARKRELEAKESTTVKALKEDFGAVVAKKDEEIEGMADLIRGLHPIADKYKVLFAEKRDLQHQFDVVMRTNQEVQQMLRNMQSEKAAAESRVKEISMVVGQVTAENEALTQQNSHLVQQIEGFESMFSKMKSKSEALEQENTQLKGAICLPDLQITPRTSLEPPPPQSMTEGRRSLPSPINQRYHQQPVVHPPPPNRPPPPLHHNQDDYRQQGAAIHLTVEGQIAPYGKPHSEHGLIIMRDLPAHHDTMAESDSPPLSKGDEQYGRDPYAHRPLAQYTASGDPHRALQRDPRQPQFPHSGPSVLGSRAHAQPEFEHGPAAVGGDARPIKHPPSASERYQAATQPPMDANQLRLHNSNSSASEASLSLPAPLTNRRRDSEATDPVQSGFEVNRRYIGEDINREIRHEARRYKEGNVAVEPAIADAEEWPFDPNLTCTFCGAMFRRGQIREFRYHIDECTARSMEGRK